MSTNKRLMAQLNESEVIVENNKQFLDNLFYTSEPVTKDGYVSYLPTYLIYFYGLKI